MSQVFRIWVVPFYRAPVKLVTVLQLEYNKHNDRYYIASQNDLYQVDQFVRFFAPGGWILVQMWQFWATFFCLLGAIALWPISFAEEFKANGGKMGNGVRKEGKDHASWNDGLNLRDLERKSLVDN